MIDNCSKNGLKNSTGVLSCLGGVEAVEDQTAYETNISGRTSSRNGEICSIGNDIAHRIKPLYS